MRGRYFSTNLLRSLSLTLVERERGGEGEGEADKLRENGRINAGDSEDVQISDGGEVHSVPQLRVLGDVLPRSTHTSTPGQSLDVYHAQYL